ncbi:MAG: hypothetical protein IJK92_06365 [Bacteroidales bacterium]|nr:hypothetical protein [Bacteroidales bacterium]
MKKFIITFIGIAVLLALFMFLFKKYTYGGAENIKTPTKEEIKGAYKNYSVSAVTTAWKESKVAAQNMRDNEFEQAKKKLPENLSEEEYIKQIDTKSLFRCRLIVIFNKNEFLEDNYRFPIQAVIYALAALIFFLCFSGIFTKAHLKKKISFDNSGVNFKNNE